MTCTMTKTVNINLEEVVQNVRDTVSDFISESLADVGISDYYPDEIFQEVLKTVCEKILNEERGKENEENDVQTF